MQLGRGIGGKAFFTVTGSLAEVEAAVEAALGVIDAEHVNTTEIIRRPTPTSRRSSRSGGAGQGVAHRARRWRSRRRLRG